MSSSASVHGSDGLLDPAGYGGGFRLWNDLDASALFAAYDLAPQSGYAWLLVSAFFDWNNASGTANTNPSLSFHDPDGNAVWLSEISGSVDAGRQGRASYAVGDGAQYGVTGAAVNQEWHAPLPLLVLDPGYFIRVSAVANPNNNQVQSFRTLIEYYSPRGGGGDDFPDAQPHYLPVAIGG